MYTESGYALCNISKEIDFHVGLDHVQYVYINVPCFLEVSDLELSHKVGIVLDCNHL